MSLLIGALGALAQQPDYLAGLPAFKEAIKNGQTVYYGFDSHLDPSGNRVVAQLVHDYIADHNLLPSR